MSASIVYESPIYFSSLQLLQRLNLKLIEIPASMKEGMSPDTIKFVLDNHPVKAVFTIPNFNNPLGFVMPDEKKREMVKLLKKYKVTLIEDDIYGDHPSQKRWLPDSASVGWCRGMPIMTRSQDSRPC